MSTVIAKNVQVGTSGTSTDNFTIFQPATPDGTLRIGNGNTGITTSQVALTSAGNLGIGTSSPGSYYAKNLVVGVADQGGITIANSATTGENYLAFADGTSGTDAYTGYIGYSHTNNFMRFATNGGGERMRIDSSGNVGIGTSSPSSYGKLTVDTSGTGTPVFYGRSADQSASRIILSNTGTGGQTWQMVAGDVGVSNSGLSFYDGTATRMRIDSSGNLLLNNTSGYNDGKIVRADNTDARVRSMIVANTNAGSSSRCGYVVNANGNSWSMEMGSVAANSNALNWTVDIFGSPTVRMALTTGGAATNSTGSWGTISDIRLKENVVDATPKLDGLMQLRVVNYNLKTDPDVKMLGFVAQEVEQVFPGLVDNDGEATGDGDFYKSVKTTVLVPMLIKAIQEQQAIIASQSATITAQQAALAALTARVEALESN